MPGRQHRELLEREQRLRAIYDGTYEYIGVLAPDGTLLEANRASLEFAPGTTREDVIGRPFWETVWFVHTPGAPEKLREAIARAAEHQQERYRLLFERTSDGIWLANQDGRFVDVKPGRVPDAGLLPRRARTADRGRPHPARGPRPADPAHGPAGLGRQGHRRVGHPAGRRELRPDRAQPRLHPRWAVAGQRARHHRAPAH